MDGWIRKQRYLIDFTLAALLRRKGRNLALVVVYTMIVFLLASVMLFSQALKREAQLLLSESPELIVQRMTAGRHALIAEDYVLKINQIRGVQATRGRLWGYFYDPIASANYTLMVPEDQAVRRGTVIIGEAVARARGAAVDDVLSLRAYDGRLFSFIVERIFSHDSALVSADLILIEERDFRAFFGIGSNQFTDIAVTVGNSREIKTIAEKVSLALPDTRPILREEILRTYAGIFGWREGIILVLLLGAVLAFVIFAWDKASGLSGEEKREIGILKAVGWETSDIIKMKFWEGLLISLTAFLSGYLLAYAHVFLLSYFLFSAVLKGWSVLYPTFELIPYIDGVQIATLFFFTVFPYAGATIVPIWRAAITDPDAAMR
jgi:ABC-type lipoprotein release transport system permease subunit